MRLRGLSRIDVDTWPRERFLALFFAILLACAWMVSTAAREHAEIRRGYFVSLAKQRAASPIPYLGEVGVLRRPAGAPLQPLRLVIRADSAQGESAARLCRLAGAAAALGAEMDVAWIALGGEVPSCVSRAAGARLSRVAGPGADTLRAQLRDARWALVDEEHRALYSRRDAPDPAEVRAVAALVSPGRGAMARADAAAPRRGEGS